MKKDKDGSKFRWAKLPFNLCHNDNTSQQMLNEKKLSFSSIYLAYHPSRKTVEKLLIFRGRIFFHNWDIVKKSKRIINRKINIKVKFSRRKWMGETFKFSPFLFSNHVLLLANRLSPLKCYLLVKLLKL